ncbi:MAG: hypothetical protein AAGE59_27110 [Cyanobacteria bacterium P01_F01_bin.86]
MTSVTLANDLAELSLSGNAIAYGDEVLAELPGIKTATLTTSDFNFVV